MVLAVRRFVNRVSRALTPFSFWNARFHIISKNVRKADVARVASDSDKQPDAFADDKNVASVCARLRAPRVMTGMTSLEGEIGADGVAVLDAESAVHGESVWGHVIENVWIFVEIHKLIRLVARTVPTTAIANFVLARNAQTETFEMQHVWSRRCSKHQIGRLVDGDLLDTRRSTNIMIFGIALGSLWASRFRHVIFPITITIIVDKRIVEAGWTHTIDLGHACKTRGPTNLPLARLRAPGCWRGVADLRRRFRAFLFSVTREQRSMQMGVCLAAHFRRRDDRNDILLHQMATPHLNGETSPSEGIEAPSRCPRDAVKDLGRRCAVHLEAGLAVVAVGVHRNQEMRAFGTTRGFAAALAPTHLVGARLIDDQIHPALGSGKIPG